MNTNVATNELPVVIGVLGIEPLPRAPILEAIARAGATAEVLTEATALSNGSAVAALVLDGRGSPERLLPAAAALAEDPRTRHLPRVIVIDGAVATERLVRFGPAAIVPEEALSDELPAALSSVVEQVREREATLQAARAAMADVRALEQLLTNAQREGQTLSHDARVLFGVILGYAANLRDGFGGSVTDEQHRQLVNIVEASTDAAALLERHVSALRRLVPPSADPARTSTPRPRVAARRHIDIGQLVEGIIALFQGIAAAKQITLRIATASTTYAWCDAMQLKQALVNVLSNALKFTPAGGHVDVTVRAGAGAGTAAARGGPAARRDIEIIVSDDGPGIPAAERECVLERGVRLERDRAIPGTGLGLATVRDIVTLHGGFVRIDETQGGGTTIALVFPADPRTRSGDRARTNGALSSVPPRVLPTSMPSSPPRTSQPRRGPE